MAHTDLGGLGDESSNMPVVQLHGPLVNHTNQLPCWITNFDETHSGDISEVRATNCLDVLTI